MRKGRVPEGKETAPTNALTSGARPPAAPAKGATRRSFDDLTARISRPGRPSTGPELTPSSEGPYGALRTAFLESLERELAWAEDDLRHAEVKARDARLRLQEAVAAFP